VKIDLPIAIIFDCQDHKSVHGFQVRNFIPRVCTIRFDSEKNDLPAELFSAYPPENAPGYPNSDNGDAVLAALSTDEYRRIVDRAKRNPFDYGVGTEAERETAQAAADAEHAQDGPND